MSADTAPTRARIASRPAADVATAFGTSTWTDAVVGQSDALTASRTDGQTDGR